MSRKLVSFLLIASFLTACISISAEPEETAPVNFVTATLAPTKAGFVPATSTPAPETTHTPTLVTPAAASCKDSAVLLRDVTIPDNTQMKAGETFTKTKSEKHTS